ncbi:hypothetical protein [Streptomyces sp. NPDC001508]|uniref:hypothetical protein n=1 Tax=Streptomyces sp. NPDC001508 TaxID=3154656 RepID=UPI00331D9EBB
MSTRQPDSDGPTGGGDGAAPVPDTVWQQFLDDSERAIRRSAPREPSARERAVPPPAAPRPTAPRPDAVGELWQPRELSYGPAWRDLDGPARRRRVGRVLGTVAAAALALSALSLLPAGPGGGPAGPDDATSQRSEDVADPLPTATASPDVLMPPVPTPAGPTSTNHSG